MHFSIILPLYNKKNHVRRAINSLLQQTHQKFEIIVVDDGSTDNSFEEVKNIQDSRIHIFRKANEGVSSARNFGIKESSYEYIAFLDADDVWKAEFLESITDLINKFPQGGAYATSYEFRMNDSVKPANINTNLYEGEANIVNYFKDSLKDPLISASSVVIKKNVFSNIGYFSTTITRGEDLEMWCRIALNYQIVFLNKILACYFKDTDNRATNTQINYSKSFMSYAENILEEQKQLGNTSFYFEEYMISRIMPKVRYLIKNYRNKEARQLLYKYKYTRYNKKKWLKNFLISFKPIYFIYKNIR